MHMARKAPGGINREVWVVPQHVHAKVHRQVCHAHANGPKAHHAQRFAQQLWPGKLAFALFHLFGGVSLARQHFGPGNAPGHIAACQHKAGQHKLHHGVGVGARRVEHHNALFAARGHGDIVHPRPGAGNGQQPFRQGRVVHGGAAHQNALHIAFGPAVYGKLLRGQFGQAFWGNVVPCLNEIHLGFPLC